MVDETKKNVIVETDFTQKMKQGSSMFSRTGQSQTVNFLIFMQEGGKRKHVPQNSYVQYDDSNDYDDS